MYNVGNYVEQVFGGAIIKQGDQTPMGFNFRDESGQLVSLTGSTVDVKIANKQGVVLETRATISDEYTVTFSIGSEDIAGSGDMRIEFTVNYANGLKEKFPSDDWQRIKITPTLDDINKTAIAYLTFEKMKADFTKEVDNLNDRVDSIIREAGDSNPEIMESRKDMNGVTYGTLPERLNSEQERITKKTAAFINMQEFSVAGNGAINDDSVFQLIESNFTDKVVELGGKTYLVNSLPTKNRYVNGKFLINGVYTDAPYSTILRQDHAVIAVGLGAAKGVPSFPSYAGDKYYKNIAIGGYAMEKAVGSYNNIAIGWQALQNMNKGEFYNIAIGNEALLNTRLTDTSDKYNATRNIGIGINALRYNINGHHNAAVGRNALQCTKNGSYNTAVGMNAQGGEAPLDLTGNIVDYTKIDVNNVTAIGSDALLRNTGDCNTAVGSEAASSMAKGVNNVAVGVNAMMSVQKDMLPNGKSKIFSSKSGTYVWNGTTITVTMNGHGFQTGYLVALLLKTGSNLKTTEENQYTVLSVTTNTFTVTAPISNSTSGSITSSWYSDNSTNNKSSDNNTVVGNYAMENSLNGFSNAIFGCWAGRNLLSSSTALFGVLAGNNLTTGEKNTAVGYGAMRYMQDGTACTDVNVSTAIGFDSRVSGSAQLQLGGTGTTSYSYGAVQQRSDKRDKTEIQNTQLGLEFINKLRPVDFKWNYREDYVVIDDATGEITHLENDGSKTRSRLHQGLIAQEVKTVMDELGVDFGGFQDHKENGGNDVLSLGYEELIAPLIKSVQELTKKVNELQEELAQTKSNA